MKKYKNFDEIQLDLKRLDLERQIAIEELKGKKYGLEDYTKPLPWVKSILKFVSKYGLLMLAKKVLK